jgi:hypothetical protein
MVDSITYYVVQALTNTTFVVAAVRCIPCPWDLDPKAPILPHTISGYAHFDSCTTHVGFVFRRRAEGRNIFTSVEAALEVFTEAAGFIFMGVLNMAVSYNADSTAPCPHLHNVLLPYEMSE